GAWYDRPNRDTPAAINKRLNFKPLAFFQTDIDLSGEKKKETSPNITTQFLQDLQDSNSDAMAFLTVYPFQGFAAVTDAQLTDLLNRVAAIIATGRSVFLRYAPEMNGSWFEYGQKPTDFKASWIKVREFIRLGLGSNADRVAFVWSPNSGFNYPWPKENQTLSPSNTPDWDVLDTDHNNVIDGQDDAYGPYYPGDDHVDWVGLSIYHYGLYYQWTQNVVPLDGYFEAYLTGVSPSVNLTSTQPFYDWFSGAGGSAASAGNKPFIVSETGAAFHYDWNPAEQHDPTLTLDVTSVSRVEIKQSWWRQFLNPAFLSKYPRIKAICTFEFDKAE
ncbi:glycoside hydrolase superfamily, partial [Zopfochytrium polystomum]